MSAIGIYDKAARKVSIHFAVTGAGGTPNGRETIFTIPSKYAPSEVKNGICNVYNSNSQTITAACHVNPGGVVYQTASSGVVHMNGTIEYVLS